MTPIRLAIAGCTGRMGATLVRLAAADPAFQLVAALTEPGDPRVGQDAGPATGAGTLNLPIRDHWEPAAGGGASGASGASDSRSVSGAPGARACAVLIEFTNPAGCRAWADWCAAHGVALVSGTTGLDDAARAALDAAARRVPVLWGPNMSVGVNLLLELVAKTAAVLGEGWDIEIVEAHHRHKADAPSGTAKALLESVCRAQGKDPQQTARHGRVGDLGPRPAGEIGVHALRLGDAVGEHEVFFSTIGETLTLRHRATTRETFARGALRAAQWLARQTPGRYAMRDVLTG